MKTILVDAVDTFVIEKEDGSFGVFGDMHEMLEGYPNPKIILTNANDEQMDTFNLRDLPYKLFTLKHNPDKPDPVYFKTMLDNFDLSADEVIYFEHNKDAVKSAQSAGITSYWYDPAEKDLDGLKEFLDKNLEN